MAWFLNKIWWYQCKCTALKYLVSMGRTEKSFGVHVQAVFSWTDTMYVPFTCTCPSSATCPLLLARFYPTVLFQCSRRDASCGPKYHHACLARLLGNATCSCWAVPSAAQQTLLFFFNPHQEPRNLYQLTQLLALVLKAEVQWCAGQITSAGRYCAVVFFGSTDAIYSCVQRSGVTNSQEWSFGRV